MSSSPLDGPLTRFRHTGSLGAGLSRYTSLFIEDERQGVGLALHELATNAGKYGALASANGRVGITWTCDEKTFSICWTERDGPPVTPPQRRGFGSVVIANLAEMSVDGTVNLQYRRTGLVWRLACPADKALELGATNATYSTQGGTVAPAFGDP